MRVLQVVGRAEGGVRRHLVQLIGRLEQHRFVAAGPAEVLQAVQSLPTVEDLWPLPVGGSLPADWAAYRRLGDRLDDEPARRFDVAHIHGWRSALALPGLIGRRLPVVWTLHTRPPAGPLARAWIGRWLRPGRWLPIRLIAVSESLAREVAHLWPGWRHRLHVVRNGLDHEELKTLGQKRRERLGARFCQPSGPVDGAWTGRSPWAASAEPGMEWPLAMPVLGYMGRLWGPKGVFDAVEVLARLARAGWPAVLLVAGDGPHREAMARLAGERGVEERLHLLGWQAPGDFLAQIDLLLHPSRSEGGFPYTVMEAMAAGVPVVGYELPPLQEVAEAARQAHGQELLHLVPTGDVAGLARRCAACLNNAETTARQAEEAARFARSAFSLDRVLEAVDRIYREAVQEAAALAPRGESLRPEPGLAGPDQVRI